MHVQKRRRNKDPNASPVQRAEISRLRDGIGQGSVRRRDRQLVLLVDVLNFVDLRSGLGEAQKYLLAKPAETKVLRMSRRTVGLRSTSAAVDVDGNEEKV